MKAPSFFSFAHTHTRRTKFGADTTPSFDFVIVGGGPSGCALAARLHEAGRFSILLIEQGSSIEQHPPLAHSVANIMQTRTLHGSVFDARYTTISDGQFSERPLEISSGKVLGGSTCINFAIWTRGAKADYDLWSEMVGSDTFKWENMLPCFEKVENRVPIRLISSTKRPHTWSSIAAAALEEVGFERINNLNGKDGNMLGYGGMWENIDDKGRATACRYFEALQEDADVDADADAGKGKLEIWTSLRVDRVVFEDVDSEASPKAVGIMTPLGMVSANREVILTAGAIQSPNILLLSGIGPAAHLSHHNIKVVHDSPQVGQGLWEHPFVDVSFRLKPAHRKHTVETFSHLKTSREHIDQWARTKTGLMTGLLFEWMSFTNMYPTVEKVLNVEGSHTETDRLALLRSDTPHIEQFVHYGHGLVPAPDPLESSYITVTNVLLTPRSRGSVALGSETDFESSPGTLTTHNPESNSNPVSSGNSATSTAEGWSAAESPIHRPRILLNQMKETLDRELMVNALEKAYEILRAPAWEGYLVREEIPSREKLLEIVRDRVATLWHLGGTCSMRTAESVGVVDNAFRVQGVRNLRVADVSVVPFALANHTQSTAYALGEKAADLIKHEYL